MLPVLLGLLRQPTSVAGLAALVGVLVAAHTGTMSWDNAIPALVGGLVAILIPDNPSSKANAEAAAKEVVEALKKAAETTNKGAVALILALPLLGLGACTQEQQQKAVDMARAACLVSGVVQPIAVAMAPMAGPTAAAAATADALVLHPQVVAACAAIGGVPVLASQVSAAPVAPVVVVPAPVTPATPAAPLVEMLVE